MAVKTITIDLAAYGLLVRRKREGLSFSDVISERRRVRGGLSEDVLDAVDAVVRDRANSPVRYPEL